MNTIGIVNNLDRQRIKKMLSIGLFASILTGVGDFFLGFAKEVANSDIAVSFMLGAPNLADWQMIVGGLLGMVGLFLSGLAFFAIYRLIADSSPRYAHIYRTGIFGFIWLAPIGCHLNMGLFNLSYKYLLVADTNIARHVAKMFFYGFSVPVYFLLIIFWGMMIIIQFKAFAKGMTPYPGYAKWFNLIVGAIPACIFGAIFGGSTAIGAAIGTMFLSFGNAFTFGGLLFTLPSEDQFEQFRQKVIK